MELAMLQALADEFTDRSPHNRVPEVAAFSPELVGLRMYDRPLFGVCASNDPYLAALDETHTGLPFEQPDRWLPGARSVLSFFLPLSERVRRSNAEDFAEPSPEWLHARIEGQAFVFALCGRLREALAETGYESVIPSMDPRFRTEAGQGDPPRYGSNWSERHVAYACGLGTFSLSRGLITRRGVAGRFGSLVTALELPATARSYEGLYEHCTRCGHCAVNCPAEAISIEHGKDHELCNRFLEEVRARHNPYYGCGKCQVNVPCETGIPR